MSITLGSAQSITGGMQVNAHDYWSLFVETGAPEMYLLYNMARKMEVTDASDITGSGFESNSL